MMTHIFNVTVKFIGDIMESFYPNFERNKLYLY